MNLPGPILVTGGGGMLATAFRKLIPDAQFLTRAEFDLTYHRAIELLLSQRRPRIVLNCAAYTKVDLAEMDEANATKVNGDAVGELARVCRDLGIKLVHFSTDYVFDGKLQRPLRPDDPVGPKSAYGRSKLVGELLLQQNPPKDWLIIRTAWLYGPSGPNFPQSILNAARAGKPLTVVNDQIGSPTFTFDLAQATLELIEKQAKGIWHIVNDGETTWHDFAAAILERFDVRASLSPISSEDWKKSRPSSAIRPSYSVLDITPFEQLTGHRTPHWKDALKRFSKLE